MIEYTIKVKDESSTLSEKDIAYDAFRLSKDNAFLENRVKEAVARFLEKHESQEAPEVTITARMVWQL